MFIPYRVDVPFNHRPVMNWLIVTGVIFVFFMQLTANADSVISEKMYSFVLDGWGIKGLLGHMWLHAGFVHLIGNLIFLWIFGNAVCSKLGNILYLPVYVGLGLIAAVSHLIFDSDMAVGASGAINGIVGMYLVFFPENNISCFFLLFLRPIFFCVSGFWLILLWFAFDLFGAFYGSGDVAYVAHIGGFLGGVGLAVLMLKMKWIDMERDEKSVLDLLLPKKKNVPSVSREELEFWRYELKKRDRKTAKTVISPKKQVATEREPKVQSVNGFIHFICSCGQKIQVSREYAGRTGRCPKCSKRVKIPER
ncbi:MAG: rhomboid family intramembrane serine protease [Sedimentisphaerales bacterium]|nr:rhomboid family intramembrane serine protease [Sedimentisphaerales bacterium]